jgi:glucose/arabinose dehydrogenase
VNGSERLQWNQIAPDSSAIHRYRYAAYVDGVPVPLSDAVCSPEPAAAGHPCSARLPRLAPGRHVLELATIQSVGDVALESVRSPPIVVDMIASASTLAAGGDGNAFRFTSGGVAYQVLTVAGGFTVPVALAALPDGRLIVAEESGVVKIVRPGEEVRIALTIDDERDGGGTTVHAIAIHPFFSRNGLVFVLYTSAREDGAVMRLVRFRELDDTLGEPAVIVDDLPADADRPAGAMALIAAGQVLVATGGTAATSSDRLLARKILRLNVDGTLPRDAPAASPVYADAVEEPLGVGINPLSGRLWLLSSRPTRANALEVVPRPMAGGALQYRGDQLSAFKNDLVVARTDGLERLRYDVARGRWMTEGLLVSGPFGKLGAVAEGPGGALYFATANGASPSPPGIDRVLRIVPEGERASGRR